MSGSELSAGALARMDKLLPYLHDWVSYRVWKTGIPGAQYAIRYNGRLALSAAVGVADLVSQEPLTSSHLMRFASHSKMFTATAVMQLVERGRMSLDAPVSNYVRELREHAIGERCIRELLDHTAGVIRDGKDGDFWQQASPFPDDESIIEMALGSSIKNAAGEKFAYSNLGYAVLGLALARASGRSWNEYVGEEIIQPLALANTFADLPADRDAEIARGYSGTHTSRQHREIPSVVLESMAPAGGITSTAEDIAVFLEAQRIGDPRLLTAHSKCIMQRVSSADPSVRRAGGGYGLGMIVEEINGHQLVGHSGGFTGYISWSMRDSVNGVVVSVATNSTDGTADEIGTGLHALLRAAAEYDSPSLDSVLGDTSMFEGRFANIWRVTDVVRIGERLVAVNPELSDPTVSLDELAIEDESNLVIAAGNGYGSVGEQVEYTRDSAGNVQSVRVGFGLTSWPLELGEAPFADPWTRLGPDQGGV